VITEEQDSFYRKGVRDQRLTEHDHIFRRLEIAQMVSAISGFIALAWLSLSVQRLGDGAKSSAATAIALAQALKEEKDTARDTLAAESTQSSSNWTKTNTLIAALAVMVSMLIGLGTFYLATKG